MLAIRVQFWGARDKDFPLVIQKGWAEYLDLLAYL